MTVSSQPPAPTFLIIGAARCATTSLHTYLEAHPDIFLSTIKETNFFSNPRFYSKGMGWYLSHFSKAQSAAVGEASTSYTTAVGDNAIVPARIANQLGDVKLIYLVRDPVARLLSHYIHYQHRGERHAEVEEVIEGPLFEDTRWQGRYFHQLELYRRHFNERQLLVISVEELARDPRSCLKRIFVHIGVAPDAIDFTKAVSRIHNSSAQSTRKGPAARWLLKHYARHLEPSRLPYMAKSVVLRAAELGAKPIPHPVLSPAQFDAVKAFYEADVKNLSRHYGINTSGWLRG